MQAYRDLDLRAHMPPSPVEHQHNALALACPHRLDELGEHDGERLNRHRGEQEPDRPTGGRMDKGREVAPLVARLHHRARALATVAPAPARDGREADPVLVGRPQRPPPAGGRAAGLALRRADFFKSRVRAGIGLGLVWPWGLSRPAEMAQPLTSPLWMDGVM